MLVWELNARTSAYVAFICCTDELFPEEESMSSWVVSVGFQVSKPVRHRPVQILDLHLRQNSVPVGSR
jgi:hypothetical protein